MDKSRGAAKRLAQEAKDRKQVDRDKPRVGRDAILFTSVI